MEDVAKAGLNDRSGVGDGHRYGDREPSKGVSDAIGLGAPDPCAIAPVRVEGGANVPTINTMGRPSLAACSMQTSRARRRNPNPNGIQDT